LEKEETGFETVTLFNTTNNAIDLTGWFLADNTGKQKLSGTIDKGEPLRIYLTEQVHLSNIRDTITIIDINNTIIVQVSHEKRFCLKKLIRRCFEIPYVNYFPSCKLIYKLPVKSNERPLLKAAFLNRGLLI